jgi:uncharacterized lipoprotein YmbA
MRPSGSVKASFSLKMDRIAVAEHLERANMAVRPGPTRIEYYALDRWAAGLDEQIAEKLETELGPPTKGRPVLAASGKIAAFEIEEYSEADEPAPAAIIKIGLALRAEDASRYTEPLLEREYCVRVPMEAATPAAAAVAFSRGVERLAAELADDVEHALSP